MANRIFLFPSFCLLELSTTTGPLSSSSCRHFFIIWTLWSLYLLVLGAYSRISMNLFTSSLKWCSLILSIVSSDRIIKELRLYSASRYKIYSKIGPIMYLISRLKHSIEQFFDVRTPLFLPSSFWKIETMFQSANFYFFSFSFLACSRLVVFYKTVDCYIGLWLFFILTTYFMFSYVSSGRCEIIFP